MTDKNKAIEEFVKLTCSTEVEARKYLEVAGWNTEAALLTYFDDRDDRFEPAANCLPTTHTSPDGESENESMNAEDDFVDVNPQSLESPSPEKKSSKSDSSKPYKRSTNVATLSSIRNPPNFTDDEDDEQLYYAGGSEHSGQQIMGNDHRSDIAGEVFKHLKQMVSVGDVELAGPSRDRRSNFSGVGYRLGQTSEDTQVVEGSSSGRTTSQEDRPELHLRLWRDGFSIGDEPLRPYSKKENREIIELILRGEVPLDIVPPGTKGAKVNVKVEDMRHSNYSTPTSRGKFFTGPGHVLGNVVPAIVKSDPPKAEAAPEKPLPAESVASPIVVNDSQPITNIAVRLPSGTRSQVRLNLTHTVDDLRTHLTAVHRELDGQTFVFMVSFPPKEVSDEKLSISDAGLVNSSLHLRIKKN